MSSSRLFLYAVFVTGVCLGLIVKDIVVPARADVAGMNSTDLEYDYDFSSAVESIVEDCEVDNTEINC